MTVIYYPTSLCMTTFYQLLMLTDHSVYDSPYFVYDPTSLCNTTLYQLLVVADYSV